MADFIRVFGSPTEGDGLVGSVKLGITGASLLAATAGVLALVWLTQPASK
jgi:hypothetical protein